MKLILLLTISGAALAERAAAAPAASARAVAPASAAAPAAGAQDISERAARNGAALHRVRRGETLAAIARAYRVPMHLLAGLNRLRSPSRLRSGRMLVIPLTPAARRAAQVIARRNARAARRPAEATARRDAGAPRRVRVRAGDSLWSIARRRGVSVRALARWNGIRRPREHKLRAGRLLVIRRPGGR
jgi:membrane-bound lytic murein transglycosylase D